MPDPSSPSVDESLPTLEGRAWTFGFALGADQILAPVWHTLTPNDARRHLFAEIDPHLAAQLEPRDVVVADEMTGESVRAALRALASVGVTVILARRFSAAFLADGPAHGVVTLVLDAPSFVHSGDRVRIDLDAGKVVNLSSGDRAPIRDLGEPERETLRRVLLSRPA